MKEKERNELFQFLAARDADPDASRRAALDSSREMRMSKPLLIAEFNADQKAKGRDGISERDMDVDLLFRKTAKELLTAKSSLLGPGMETQHDVMFNCCWKVAFESALAAVFFRNRAYFQDNIARTLAGLQPIVLNSLKAATGGRGNATDKGLLKAFQEDGNAVQAFHAREKEDGPISYPIVRKHDHKDIPSDQIVAYYERVFAPESYDSFFEEQLTAIYNFGDFVTRPHKFSQISKPDSSADLKRDLTFTGTPAYQTTFITEMMRDWAKYKLLDRPGWFDQKKEGAPSVSRVARTGKAPGALTEETNYSGNYGGIWAVKGNRTVDVFNPYLAYVEDLLVKPFYDTTGVGLWRPQDRTKAALDEASVAMHRLDMPLIGGISGGMGTYLITMKRAGDNVKREDLLKCFFAAYAVMILKGYHSFHEVAIVGERVGLWYHGGDYLSLLSEATIDAIPQLDDLVQRFGDRLGRNKAVSKRNTMIFGLYKSEADPGQEKPRGLSKDI